MVRRSDIVFFFALILGLYVAWLLRTVLLLIYISALFAVVLMPAIDGIRRLRIGRWQPGRGMAVLILVVAGLGAMALFFGVALPPIFHDARAFAFDWPHRSGELIGRIHRLPFAGHINAATLEQDGERAASGLLGAFTDIAGGAFWFFVWLILTLYFIVDGDRAFAWIMSLFPPAQRGRLERTLLRARNRVRHWLLGQGTLMLLLGASSALVFGLLRLKYFYALAMLAGVANLVPIIGPLTSVTVACLVAATDSWAKVAGVLIFYFVYQQTETAFLAPRIMKSTLKLPPLAVIIALSVGGALAGVLGALVAVPTAALVAVIADEYLVQPHAAAGAAAGP
jgi:predicted PurR-regulated permease PerM